MSTVLINIDAAELPGLRKFVRDSHAKMRVIKDEEEIMEKLVEEGLKSENIPLATLKRELKKNAGSR
jgi:hypothetical protein